MKLILHRGITVEPANVEKTICNIKEVGLSGDEGFWKFPIPDIMDVSKRLDLIYSTKNPSIEDIFKDTPYIGICACGDKLGAKFYALEHNQSEIESASILISFVANINDVYVDCRDFLCTAFQGWDQKTNSLIEQ